jgi:hypothetical protein
MNLARNEAVVIFEFLSRYADTGELAIEDQAEQHALWDVCSSLEPELHELISSNYDEILRSARERVRDSTD